MLSTKLYLVNTGHDARLLSTFIKLTNNRKMLKSILLDTCVKQFHLHIFLLDDYQSFIIFLKYTQNTPGYLIQTLIHLVIQIYHSMLDLIF